MPSVASGDRSGLDGGLCGGLPLLLRPSLDGDRASAMVLPPGWAESVGGVVGVGLSGAGAARMRVQ